MTLYLVLESTVLSGYLTIGYLDPLSSLCRSVFVVLSLAGLAGLAEIDEYLHNLGAQGY